MSRFATRMDRGVIMITGQNLVWNPQVWNPQVWNPRRTTVITGQDPVWSPRIPLQLPDYIQVTLASGTAAARVEGEVSPSPLHYGTYLAPEKQTRDLSVSIIQHSLWEKFLKVGTEMIITKKGRYIAKFCNSS